MKFYQVGGCVRDAIIGRDYNDIDYVVVGSTPEEMLSKGFTEVGSDFPVFIHPVSKDEYALARTEYSTGDSYKDFKCTFGTDVTLEDDLLRRDLTINSIALNTCTGELTDPYGGVEDIKNKVLRHTSEAFSDDPLRLLRLARFYAQLGTDWTIAPETIELCNDMLSKGMLESLTPERIWKETEKALKSDNPRMFFQFLYCFGIFPELNELDEIPQKPDHHPEGNVWIHSMLVVQYSGKAFKDPMINFAGLMHDLGKYPSYKEHGTAHGHEDSGLKPIKDFCIKYTIPNDYRDLALMVCKQHTKVHGLFGRNNQGWTKPRSIMNMFQETNALTKLDRFEQMLLSCVADARGRGLPDIICKNDWDKSQTHYRTRAYPQKAYLMECLYYVKRVDTKAISKKMLTEGKSGIMIGEAIRVARIDAIRRVQREWKLKELNNDK